MIEEPIKKKKPVEFLTTFLFVAGLCVSFYVGLQMRTAYSYVCYEGVYVNPYDPGGRMQQVVQSVVCNNASDDQAKNFQCPVNYNTTKYVGKVLVMDKEVPK